MSSECETKVCYHVDEEETPYLTKVPKPASEVTLGDLKAVIRKSNQYKYFFKRRDVEFGIVKEEITSDSGPLPLYEGRIVCYLELGQGSVVNNELRDGDETETTTETNSSIALPLPPGLERGAGVGETRPPSFRGGHVDVDDEDEDYDDSESAITSVSQAAERRRAEQQRQRHHQRPARLPGPGIRPPGAAAHARFNHEEASSMVSSELDSSAYDDGDSMASSTRFTTSTEHTSVSRQMMRHKKYRKRQVPAHLMRAGSMSSVSDSTASFNDIITVILNMDSVNFLGISIVGQSNKFGDDDAGIFVGSIMKGGAVALDGRIEPGDMILQVNDINFDAMSNDDAVRVLREVVQKPGPIKLVVAKCWDSTSKSYGTSGGAGGTLPLQRTEPVRPIDPGAWVAHTAAVRGTFV